MKSRILRFTCGGSILSLVVLMSGCVEQAPAAMEQGVVLSALPTQQEGENTGAGAVTGLVVGAALGAAIGGQGAGQVVGAIAGSIAGSSAGTALENANRPPTGIAYTIKLSDEQIVTIVEHLPPGNPIFPAGSQVTVETSGRVQHVVLSSLPVQ